MERIALVLFSLITITAISVTLWLLRKSKVTSEGLKVLTGMARKMIVHQEGQAPPEGRVEELDAICGNCSVFVLGRLENYEI